MDPKQTILKNIMKKPILDERLTVFFFNNMPIPSWIELSLISLATDSHSFCPKSYYKYSS